MGMKDLKRAARSPREQHVGSVWVRVESGGVLDAIRFDAPLAGHPTGLDVKQYHLLCTLRACCSKCLSFCCAETKK